MGGMLALTRKYRNVFLVFGLVFFPTTFLFQNCAKDFNLDSFTGASQGLPPIIMNAPVEIKGADANGTELLGFPYLDDDTMGKVFASNPARGGTIISRVLIPVDPAKHYRISVKM